MDAAHATAIAALVRALVECAAQQWRAGTGAPRLSAAQLRLAAWKASESGVEGALLHPLLNTPCPGQQRGRGARDPGSRPDPLGRHRAHRQRATMMNTQRLTAVVIDAVDRTHGTEKTPRRRSRRLQAT